jgi:hypothetical protein
MTNAIKMTGDARRGVDAFDRRFEVIADDDAAVFFPKTRGVDAGKVALAMRAKRGGVGEFLRWQREAGLPEPEWRERVRTIARRGMWVNAPDGNGFVLLNPTTGRAVTDRNGGYYRLTPREAMTLDTSEFEPDAGVLLP